MSWEGYPASPEHTCHAWQGDASNIPADAVASDDRRSYFYINMSVTISTYSVQENGDTDDTPKITELEEPFLVPVELLVVESDKSRLAVSDMLSAVDVPIDVQSAMIREIVECACSMASTNHKARIQVLPMVAEIHLTDCVEDVVDDDYDEYEGGGGGVLTAQVPASKAAVEALEAVEARVSGGLASKECVVCQEDVVVGSDQVKRMPCRHIFHGNCIIQWLNVSNFCPICRFRLPTD